MVQGVAARAASRESDRVDATGRVRPLPVMQTAGRSAVGGGEPLPEVRRHRASHRERVVAMDLRGRSMSARRKRSKTHTEEPIDPTMFSSLEGAAEDAA